MTLLEAVIAFVLLALVGVVCLDQSRGASQLQRSSAEWERAIAVADAALATATAGATSAGDATQAMRVVQVRTMRACRSRVRRGAARSTTSKSACHSRMVVRTSCRNSCRR